MMLAYKVVQYADTDESKMQYSVKWAASMSHMKFCLFSLIKYFYNASIYLSTSYFSECLCLCLPTRFGNNDNHGRQADLPFQRAHDWNV